MAALTVIENAVRNGDFAAAADQLEHYLGQVPSARAQWLQLAGLRRQLRQPRRALAAVLQALALAPLDFVALALKAQLLERLEPHAAGAAWAEALAQHHGETLPPPLAAAIVRGIELRDGWIAQRGAAFTAAIAGAGSPQQGDAAWRIERFRTNVLRETRVWHSSPTHFHYPGLVEREFHPRERFAWLPALEAQTASIRSELEAALASQRAELLPYIDYQSHEALAQWRPLNHNPDWSALHLWRQGELVAANAALFPATLKALSALPLPKIPGASPNAMFSLLAPHTVIPPHVGVNNARLVCHLPLIVPAGGCWFRVGAERREWREGEAFVFDDTIEHEAANPTGQLRAVLIIDLWHPDLEPSEQAAIAALIAAEHTGSGIGLIQPPES